MASVERRSPATPAFPLRSHWDLEKSGAVETVPHRTWSAIPPALLPHPALGAPQPPPVPAAHLQAGSPRPDSGPAPGAPSHSECAPPAAPAARGADRARARGPCPKRGSQPSSPRVEARPRPPPRPVQLSPSPALQGLTFEFVVGFGLFVKLLPDFEIRHDPRFRLHGSGFAAPRRSDRGQSGAPREVVAGSRRAPRAAPRSPPGRVRAPGPGAWDL